MHWQPPAEHCLPGTPRLCEWSCSVCPQKHSAVGATRVQKSGCSMQPSQRNTVYIPVAAAASAASCSLRSNCCAPCAGPCCFSAAVTPSPRRRLHARGWRDPKKFKEKEKHSQAPIQWGQGKSGVHALLWLYLASYPRAARLWASTEAIPCHQPGHGDQ